MHPVFIAVHSLVCHQVERSFVVELVMQFCVEVVEIKIIPTISIFVCPLLKFPHEQVGIRTSGRKGERSFILDYRPLDIESGSKQSDGHGTGEFLLVAVFGIDVDNRR